ncbi:MAG: hypothetical protein ACI8TX_001647 [Hyphomicrobiaceae bacterium]|jgi:hypothetical protein
MLTATQSRPERRSDQPDLISPPRRLSARRFEEMFGLTLGAWKGRRLFVVRASNDRFAPMGIRGGDYLVIEPGACEREGQIVLRRTTDGLSLSRVPTATADPMADSLWLPFRQNNDRPRTTTVGSLIGVARTTPSGNLQPLGRSTRHSSSSSRSEIAYRKRVPPQQNPQNTASTQDRIGELQKRLTAWTAWIEQSAVSLAPDSQTVVGWRRLGTGLRTLIECLEVAHSPRLASALLREARTTLRTMESEASRHRMADVDRICA